MKKITAAVMMVMLLLTVLPLGGCRLQHYTRSEAEEWAEEYFDEAVTISKDYIERENEEGYTDLVWQAWLDSNPDLVFEIISEEYWGMESISHSMDTTYEHIYGEYGFNRYISAQDSVFSPSDEQYVTSDYSVSVVFADRDELRAAAEEMDRINAYLEEIGCEGLVCFCFAYDDPLSAVDSTDVFASFRGSDSDQVIEEVTGELAINAADHRFAVDEFTTEELISAVAKFRCGFNIIREDGSVVSYPDLALSRFGYGMSFGTFYEVLVREGFSPEGTFDAFSVTGTDGSVYQFSYWFNDYPFDVSSGYDSSVEKNGYYYIRNGEKVPMDAYFYNHFRSGLFSEITGMSYDEVDYT